MIGNNQSSQEQMLEEQARQERHMQMQSMPSEDPRGIGEYTKLIESDLPRIRAEINEDTLRILDMLIAKDFALGNLSEADINELKFLRPITKLKLEAIHPGESTLMQGKVRELVYTDNGRLDVDVMPLEPIGPYEDIRIDEVLNIAHLLASRSKGGFQWDQIAKSYTVSEIRDQDDDDGGWWNFG